MFLRFLVAGGAFIAACLPELSRAADQTGSVVEASLKLFGCFNQQTRKGEELGWSELAYYRAIQKDCSAEVNLFKAVNNGAIDPSQPAAAIKAHKTRTERAVRGALLDAALQYGRITTFRFH